MPRGGARPGAGRPRGALNKALTIATAQQERDAAAARADLAERSLEARDAELDDAKAQLVTLQNRLADMDALIAGTPRPDEMFEILAGCARQLYREGKWVEAASASAKAVRYTTPTPPAALQPFKFNRYQQPDDQPDLFQPPAPTAPGSDAPPDPFEHLVH